MMKTKILLLVLVFTLAAVNGIWAYEIDAANALKMKEVVYGASIDTKIAFYQKRVYLADSEFKILADVGRNAAAKLDFLMAHRSQLIKKMVDSNVEMKQPVLSGFIGKQLYTAGLTKEIYSASK